MEKIVKTTTYWLLKPVTTERKYFYIRSITDNVQNINWFIGYKNHMGLISSVGGDLKPETIDQLEKEFQESLLLPTLTFE